MMNDLGSVLQAFKQADSANDESTYIRKLKTENASLKAENAALRRRVNSVLVFTADELKAHDEALAKSARDSYKEYVLSTARTELKAQVDEWQSKAEEMITEQWEKASREFKKGSPADNFRAWETQVLSVPIKVLVRDMGWKPITEESCGDSRQKLVKFCQKCQEELMNLCIDDNEDIRDYARKVAEETGAGFVLVEEDI